MAGRYSAELAFVAGETYVALDSERRRYWDDLSALVVKIVSDELENTYGDFLDEFVDVVPRAA